MTPLLVVSAIGLITIIWLRRQKEREAIAVGLIYLVVFALAAYVLWSLDLSRLRHFLSAGPP